jgi:hypothetical protein
MIRVFVCIICNLHGSYYAAASLLRLLTVPSLLDDSIPQVVHALICSRIFCWLKYRMRHDPHGRSSIWRSRSIAPKLSKNDLNRSI